MPLWLVNHYDFVLLMGLKLLHKANSLSGDLLIKLTPLLIILYNLEALLFCLLYIPTNKQIDRFFAVHHTPRSIDHRTNLKDDTAHINLLIREVADIDNPPQTRRRITIELLQAKVGQYAVFSQCRDHIARNAHGYQIKQRVETTHAYVVVDGKGLHKFEANTTPRKLLKWVGIIRPLGVEYRHSIGQHSIRRMVVAYDKINP